MTGDRMMRRSLALSLVLLASVAGNAFAIGQARITGKVVDAVTKKPIPEAVITVTATEGKTFKADYKVKADGTYAVMVLDGTLHYEFTYAAPNYRPYKEVMKLKLSDPNFKDVELVPGNAAVTT